MKGASGSASVSEGHAPSVTPRSSPSSPEPIAGRGRCVQPGTRRPLLALLCLLGLGAAPPATGMQIGDWVMRCDTMSHCRIVGMAKDRGRPRVLVTIDRSAEPGANYQVMLMFTGLDGPPPSLRLFLKHPRTIPPPLRLNFEEEMPGAGFLRQDTVKHFLRLASLDAPTEIQLSGLHYADMPRGSIGLMLARIERVQHEAPALPASDNDAPFDMTFLRMESAVLDEVPGEATRICGRVANRGVRGWRLDREVWMWIVDCPGRSRILIQRGEGAVQPMGGLPAGVASFDPPMLTVTARKDGRADCGTQHLFGWSAGEGFMAVERREMPICRGIAPSFWPVSWSARRWRILG